MSTTLVDSATDPRVNFESTRPSITAFSLMAPNDVTVSTMADIYGVSSRTATSQPPVDADALRRALSHVDMSHLIPLSTSTANPDTGSNNTTYAAPPPTMPMIYPAPENIANAATTSNGNAVPSTGPKGSSKPSHPASRVKDLDTMLDDPVAAPGPNQKQVCSFRLTYHWGNNGEKSMVPITTKLLGYQPTTGTYKVKNQEIKEDNSKFAMPSLDKALCQRITYKITTTNNLDKMRIIMYIMKYKTESVKAGKYVYKAILVSDPHEGQQVLRDGPQKPTMNEAARSLLRWELGEFADAPNGQTITTLAQPLPPTVPALVAPAEAYNPYAAQQPNHDQQYQPAGMPLYNAFMPPAADPSVAPTEPQAVDINAPDTFVSQVPSGLFGNAYTSQPGFGYPSYQWNQQSYLPEAAAAEGPATAGAMIDQNWAGDFTLSADEAAGYAVAPSYAYINQSDLGNLYHPTSQQSYVPGAAASNGPSTAASAMPEQSWAGNFAPPAAEPAAFPAEPVNGTDANLGYEGMGGEVPSYFDMALDAPDMTNEGFVMVNDDFDMLNNEPETTNDASNMANDGFDMVNDDFDMAIDEPDMANSGSNLGNDSNPQAMPADELDLDMFDGPLFSNDGPDFFAEALDASGDPSLTQDLGFDFDDASFGDMPAETTQTSMPGLGSSLGEDLITPPTPSLITPPTLYLTTPPTDQNATSHPQPTTGSNHDQIQNPTLSGQFLCDWNEMIPGMGYDDSGCMNSWGAQL